MNDDNIPYRYENGDYIITYDTNNTISNLIIGKKDKQNFNDMQIIGTLYGDAADFLYVIIRRYASCDRFIQQAKLDLKED